MPRSDPRPTDAPLRTMEEALEAKMTEQGVKLLRTPAEVVDALRILLPTNIPGFDGYQVLRALRSRIAPPDPRREGLRERLRWHIEQPAQFPDRVLPIELLRECLAAMEPAAPQPLDWEKEKRDWAAMADTLEELIDAVDEAMGTETLTPGEASWAAERAIRAAFAAGRKK